MKTIKKFTSVAVGGTFDILHKGHITLFAKAFSISQHVIIGITSDKFTTQKQKQILHNYNTREHALKNMITSNFPNSSYAICKIEDEFGPTLYECNIDALIVSNDTKNIGYKINKTRKKLKLSQLKIIVMPIVIAEDGKSISSTRIRNYEIDKNGKLNNC